MSNIIESIERAQLRKVPRFKAGDTVRVDFQLDKAIPPGGGDIRELGIVVLSIGLEANK